MPFHNESLDAIVERFSDRDLPPVAQWQPQRVCDVDIRIDDRGIWYYCGSAIERARMVALFSTVLRKDGGEYFLVTPAEKLRIVVEDAPFIAQLLDVSGAGETQKLKFTDNVGNQFTANREHYLWIRHLPDESRPYVMVRDGLAALLSRPVYYQLAELMVQTGQGDGVYSCGEFFPLS